MPDWLDGLDESLTPPQRALVGGVAELLDDLQLPGLDPEACTASVDDLGVHIVLAHRRLGPVVEIDDVGDLLISYGSPDDRWAWEYAEPRYLPKDGDPLSTMLTFLRRLLTGHVELQVRRRPWGVATRSDLIAEGGSRQLLLRGGTVRPYLRWQTTPDVLRFDFTEV